MIAKDILILSKSRKWNGFCVAGCDLSTNEWVRIISHDPSIHHSVPAKDILIVGTKEEVQLLDIIRVNLTKVPAQNPNPHQVENWEYDTATPWKKVKSAGLDDIPKSLVYKGNYLYYNTKNCLTPQDMQAVKPDAYMSLVLIPNYFCDFSVKEYEGQKKVYAILHYNGIAYPRIALTDPHWEELAQKQYNATKADFFFISHVKYFVVSLGGLFDMTKCYYKLIASVIADKNAKLIPKKKQPKEAG